MSTASPALITRPLIRPTGCLVAASTFLGIAVIAAIARAIIRIHYLKRMRLDDYLFFLGTAALICSSGLYFKFLDFANKFSAAIEGKSSLTSSIVIDAGNVVSYSQIAETLAWTTIFAIKFSFLFHFRTLVNKLPRMQIWWWITFVVLVPIAGLSISAPFIVCPFIGLDVIAKCATEGKLALRYQGMWFYTVVTDIITDLMLISIPVIVLRKTTLSLLRKFSIGFVSCLSLIIVAIAIFRGISCGIFGINQEIMDLFWVQVEASISVIVACPAAYRTLFLHTCRYAKWDNHNLGQLSWLNKQGKRNTHLSGSGAVVGLETMIHGSHTRLESRSEDGSMFKRDAA